MSTAPSPSSERTFVEPDYVFISLTIIDVLGLPPRVGTGEPPDPFVIAKLNENIFTTPIIEQLPAGQTRELEMFTTTFAVPKTESLEQDVIVFQVKDHRKGYPVDLVFAEGTIRVVDIIENRYAEKSMIPLTSTHAATMRAVVQEGREMAKRGLRELLSGLPTVLTSARDDNHLYSSNLVISAKVVETPTRLEDDPKCPVVGKLTLSLRRVVYCDPVPAPGSCYALIKFGQQWKKLIPQPRTSDAANVDVWNTEMTFDVRDATSMVNLVIVRQFRTCEGPLGRMCVRLSTLYPSKLYAVTNYPLVAAYKEGYDSTSHGTLSFSITFQYKVSADVILKALIKPKQSKGKNKLAERVRKFGQFEFLQRYNIPENVVRACLAEDLNPEFDLATLKRNKSRLADSLKSVKLNVVEVVKDVIAWKNIPISVSANVLWVYLCFHPKLILPFLCLSFAALLTWKCTSNRGRPCPPHPTSRGEEDATDVSNSEPQQQDVSSSLNSIRVPTTLISEMQAKLDEIKSTVQLIQNSIGDAASAIERVEALLRGDDIVTTSIVVVVLIVGAIVLYLIPSSWVFAVVGLFVLRHPALRDEDPPPVMHVFSKLPTKLDSLAAIQW
eukprot:PhF_6_TR14170/c0_g1_i1/m.22674